MMQNPRKGVADSATGWAVPAIASTVSGGAMSRRKRKGDADEMWDAFVEVCRNGSVWIGPVVAFGVLLLIGGVIPAVLGMPPPKPGSNAASPFQTLAGVCALVVLAAWGIGLLERYKRRSLLDSRTGPESLRQMSWQDFELLVGEAYRRQGYAVEETGGGGADGGIDLTLRRNDETTLVQCKQWKTYKVSVKIARELFGVMAAEKAHRGVIVTCGRFTRDAKTFAENKPLELMDGAALWRLVEQVKKDQAAAAPSGSARSAIGTQEPSDKLSCPKCGSPLVLRTARKGTHAGSKFYGCVAFPKCRFVRDAGSG